MRLTAVLSCLPGAILQPHVDLRSGSQDYLKQNRDCQLARDVANWSSSFWELFDEIKTQPSSDPCEVVEPESCSCMNSTIEIFQDMLLNAKQDVQTEIGGFKHEISTNEVMKDKYMNDLKTNYSVLESDINTMKQKSHDFDQDIDVMKQQNSAFSKEIQNLKPTSKRNEKEITDLKLKLTEYTQENFNLKLRYKDCENNITFLEKRIESLTNEISDLTERMATNVKLLQDELKNCVKTNTFCPDHFTKVGRGCYSFSTEAKTPDKALKICQAINPWAILLAIQSREEWDTIKNYIKQDKTRSEISWIFGATDREKEGSWKYMELNRPLYFTAWCPGEPNNGGGNEGCAEFRKGANDICWNDIPCTIERRFICEYE